MPVGFFDDFPGSLERPLPPDASDAPAGMVGGFVSWRIVLVRTEMAYAAIQAFEAFPSGLHFELVARFHDRDLDPETWHPFLRDHRGLRIGVQFSDGRSGATELFAAHPRAMRPGEVLISPRGGVGHRDEHHMRMWLWPLPPPGPMSWISVWPEMDIGERSVEVDGSELVAAAANAERLWPDG